MVAFYKVNGEVSVFTEEILCMIMGTKLTM